MAESDRFIRDHAVRVAVLLIKRNGWPSALLTARSICYEAMFTPTLGHTYLGEDEGAAFKAKTSDAARRVGEAITALEKLAEIIRQSGIEGRGDWIDDLCKRKGI